MKLIRQLKDVCDELRCGAVAIGNFDGVHLGHAHLMRQLRMHANKVNGPAIIFTFDPHPVRLLRPGLAPPPLTWTARKAELLDQLGIDALIAYPTDIELLSLSPREFFDRIICETLQAKAMVEGPNFFFGRERAGNVQVLEQYCRGESITLEIVEPRNVDDQIISSSRIREQIRQGHVGEARLMLTQPYRIRGMVTHGAGRGAKIGFPTANIDAIDTLVPAHGVYAGRAYVHDQIRPAAINIGPNPTFGEEATKTEVHLIDFDRSIYGQPLEVDFIERLRDTQKFDSVDELIEQLKRDVADARKAVANIDNNENNGPR